MSSCDKCDNWYGHTTDPDAVTVACPLCGRRYYECEIPEKIIGNIRNLPVKTPYGSNRKARRRYAAELRRSKA